LHISIHFHLFAQFSGFTARNLLDSILYKNIMKTGPIILTVFISCILVFSCKHSEKNIKTSDNSKMENQISRTDGNAALPPVIIYKTAKDYSKNIPVNLSPDRKSLVSYPDIRDIYYAGKLAYPTVLAGGYLLDNRGVGPNVAFLDYTYEQYQSLGETPSADELLKHVIDTDPLTELYSCKCNRDTAYLNKLISTGGLINCRNLKL
jgi:hypothetical protein